MLPGSFRQLQRLRKHHFGTIHFSSTLNDPGTHASGTYTVTAPAGDNCLGVALPNLVSCRLAFSNCIAQSHCVMIFVMVADDKDVEKSAKERLLISVASSSELEAAIKEIAQQHPQTLLLFRGQNNLHPTVRSGLSRPDVRYEPDVDRGFSAIAGSILKHQSLNPKNIAFRKAVLQHYGYPTHYVDLTADVEVAAWFATYQSQPRRIVYGGVQFRFIDQRVYVERESGTGYLVVLAIPNADDLKQKRRLFDISTLEPFLRPQRQKAWLAYDRSPLLPDFNDYWVATIAIDCTKFTSELTSSHLFPLPTEDEGFNILMSLPYVEVPSSWIPDKDGKHDTGKQRSLNFGMRALPLPEYVHSSSKDEYNHKWNDRTLTESGPMQSWVAWQFELSSQFPGITGNVSQSTKITLSPRVKALLYSAPDDVPLRWPSVGSDELLFTFAQYGHDKVIDIEYPYEGVWLHRDKDLIFEHQMTSDEDELGVHPGHVYEFVGEELLRQEVRLSCECKSPESHDARVHAMLRLSAFIEIEQVILVPHPFRIPSWYVAL
jgi:hypothetical protein